MNDKVGSGAFHSASDVVRESLEALIDREDTLDRWLRETVVAGHQEYLSDPSKVIPADEILERIRRRKRSAG
jgi:Arc/MetJ-type ribon-helix-helix transcriptional regulator